MIFILKLCFFLAPFPVFINLTDLSLLLVFPTDIEELFDKVDTKPVPVVLFCYFYYQAIATIFIINKSKKFSFIQKKHKSEFLLVIILMCIFFYISNMPNITILQLILPLIGLLFIAIPTNIRLTHTLTKYYLFGIFTLSSLHLISIFITNDYSFLNVDRHINFSTIFGLRIYQSQTTYPNLLGLFSMLFLWLYFCQPKKYFSKPILLLFIFLLILLGGFSETRMFLFDAIIIFLTFILLLVIRLYYNFNIAETCLSLLIIIAVFISFDIKILEGSIYRFNLHGTADREMLIFDTLNFIIRNIDDLLFYGDGVLQTSAHNFILGLITSVGLICSSFYLLMMTFLFLSFTKTVVLFNDKFNATNKKIIHYGLFLLLIGNSTFNTAVTQPIYIFNFMIINCIIISNYYRDFFVK